MLVAILLFRAVLKARHKAGVPEKQKTTALPVEKAVAFPYWDMVPINSTAVLLCKDTAKVISVYKLSVLLMIFCEVLNF